jgi:hypothetical protein
LVYTEIPNRVDGWRLDGWVEQVHADNGNGFVQPADLNLTKAQDGLYIHVAVEGGANNQLTEAVPPRRLFETLGTCQKECILIDARCYASISEV